MHRLAIAFLLSSTVVGLPGVPRQGRVRPVERMTPIAAKYSALGGEGSVLGRPASDERPTPDGVGRFRHFERGSIYWHPSTGAHEVHGLIRQKYAELGWERSFLGYPTSDETPIPGTGAFNQFQGGAIYWYAANNAIEVKKLGDNPPARASARQPQPPPPPPPARQPQPPPPPPAGQPSTSQVNIAKVAKAVEDVSPATAPANPAVLTPPVDPGPLGKGSAEGSLNDLAWNNFPECTGDVPPAVQSGFALLTNVLKGLGADAPTFDRRCGHYTREIAAGVTLGAPFSTPGQKPAWGFLGGRGDLMADSLLCLLKDIGDDADGRVRNVASVPVGIGKVELQQTVGLTKFDPAAKRAELYQVTRICAPLLGCLDTGRQNIVATVRASTPAWPGGMKAGDYGIANSYAVELATDWSATKVAASLPPITIVTPYGQVTAKPGFSYATNLLPIDTPFTFRRGSMVEMFFPGAQSVSTPLVQDTYGRSGVPFVLNVASHLPTQPGSPNPPPSGWSSQLGLGGRDGGQNAEIWSPPASSSMPLRPDFNFTTARSALEHLPAANFTAKAPVRFEPPNPKSFLPGSVQSILSSVELWVEVTPAFMADYAAQFALFSREGMFTNSCLPMIGEFGRTCGLAESAVGLQAKANGRIQITGTVHLKLSFIDLGLFSPPDVNVTKSFTVPLPSPGETWDPASPITDVKSGHQSSKAGWAMHATDAVNSSLWQGVKGLSGATAEDVRQFVNACYAAPPKHLTPIPPPTHDPGSADDLMPKLLPCNICVADIRQTKYDPFVIFEVKDRKPGLPVSRCEWQENAGCYDLCSWNGSSWTRVEQAAAQILGAQCSAPRPPVIK